MQAEAAVVSWIDALAREHPPGPGQTLFVARVGPKNVPFARVVDLPPPYQDLATLLRNQEDRILFLRMLSQRMHGEMLSLIAPVPCSGCGQPAVQLQVAPECFGNRNQNFVLADPVVPLCAARACCEASLRLAQTISEEARAAGWCPTAGVCERCGAISSPAKGPLMKCGQCKEVWYCGVDCQRAHWPEHKPHCIPAL